MIFLIFNVKGLKKEWRESEKSCLKFKHKNGDLRIKIIVRYEDDEKFVRFLISVKLFWLYWKERKRERENFYCAFFLLVCRRRWWGKTVKPESENFPGGKWDEKIKRLDENKILKIEVIFLKKVLIIFKR